MSDQEMSTACGSCGQSLEEDPSQPAEKRQPCPQCGSLKRTINVSIQERVTVRTMLRMQGKHEGKGKPFIDQIQGDDLQRKSGIWMKLSRIIDRDSDLYHETVINPETGEVVHECKEPLSEHRGHGADKRKNGD